MGGNLEDGTACSCCASVCAYCCKLCAGLSCNSGLSSRGFWSLWFRAGSSLLFLAVSGKVSACNAISANRTFTSVCHRQNNEHFNSQSLCIPGSSGDGHGCVVDPASAACFASGFSNGRFKLSRWQVALSTCTLMTAKGTWSGTGQGHYYARCFKLRSASKLQDRFFAPACRKEDTLQTRCLPLCVPDQTRQKPAFAFCSASSVREKITDKEHRLTGGGAPTIQRRCGASVMSTTHPTSLNTGHLRYQGRQDGSWSFLHGSNCTHMTLDPPTAP